MSTRYFRPYTNTDVVGCELGGAVKNVIALAYGIATAMGLGDNSKATLITRGLAETARLGVALGADPLTFSGLAGLGDLIATCSSPLSRNRTFGEHLGRGETLEQAQASTRQTAEGVKSCLSILRPGPISRGGDADYRAGGEGLPRGAQSAYRAGEPDESGNEVRARPYRDATRVVRPASPMRYPATVPARSGLRRALPPAR